MSLLPKPFASTQQRMGMSLIGFALAGSLNLASAQTLVADPAVRESTDPARAASIMQRAQALREAQGREAALPKLGRSAEVLRGVSAGGFPFLSGGITVDDRSAMRAERQRYSLWVATLAKPSGAYLSDAALRILDLQTGRAVLDAIMDGPWYMVALPPGHYEVQTSLQAEGMASAQTLRATVRVPSAKGAADPRQAVFRFAADVDVSPDIDPADRANPFGADAKKR